MKILILCYFAVAALILKGAYNWVRAIFLRLSFLIGLGRICRENGFELKKPRAAFASFFRYSPKPDIIVKTGDAEYLIRLITCRARKRIYHFADHEWFVRALRLMLLLMSAPGESLTLFRKLKRLPPLDEKYLTPDSKVILLFNPSPIVITFTTHSNRREIGADSADFDGWLIYSANGFKKLLKSETQFIHKENL